MDIYCPRCGEPWDIGSVQHEMTPAEQKDLLTGRGCSRQCRTSPPSDSRRASIAVGVLASCGDDLDGAAALMEDFAA